MVQQLKAKDECEHIGAVIKRVMADIEKRKRARQRKTGKSYALRGTAGE